MRRINFFGLFAIISGLGFLTLVACSKDDGCETKTYYLDKDMDNYGISRPTMACKPPTASVGQYVTQSGDADDNDPNINPGCDLVFYLDEDNDGFGVGEPLTFCENPDDTMYTDVDTAFDCDDGNPDINPDVFITYYPDTDGDGHGDPNGETISLPGCDSVPEGFVTDNTDCNDNNPLAYPGAENITYYLDEDDDGYGDDSNFDTRGACEPVAEYNYALQGGDCNDKDPSINPDAEENPNDGIDSNCDGAAETIIWSGPTVQFNKAANANWVDNSLNHDQLTENVALTRSTGGYITNIAWWANVIGATPTETEDLPWEYMGRKEDPPVADVGDTEPFGGPYGVRWAILEQGSDTPAWDNFNMYGTLGEETNFYSLNNIASICFLLDADEEVVSIIDDFGVEGSFEETTDFDTHSLSSLVGKTLGVWLVEENIYFTLTFETLSNINIGGGPMSYTRSTPNN